MRSVHGRQLHEAFAQLFDIRSGQPAIGEPTPYQPIDDFMAFGCRSVVVFEAIDQGECSGRFGIVGCAQARKERILFVGRVPRRSRQEICRGALELSALRVTHFCASGLVRDRRQHRKKVFDSAVTIAQEPERLVKVMVRPMSNLQQHVTYYAPTPKFGSASTPEASHRYTVVAYDGRHRTAEVGACSPTAGSTTLELAATR